MLSRNKRPFNASLVVLSLLCVYTFNQGALAQPAANLSVRTTFGLSTYKSTMVQSNDTGNTIGYGLGVSSGGDRGMAMGLEREQSTFSFALNNASIALGTQDVDVTYRWGPVYLGLLFTETSWYAKAPPDANGDSLLDQDATAEEYLDILSNGYGARLGAYFAMGRRSSLSLDIRYGTTSKVQQTIPEEPSTGGITGTSPALDRTVALGPRLSLDIGTSIGITREVLSFIAGYRYRTYALTVATESFSELHTSTYIGLLAGWNF